MSFVLLPFHLLLMVLVGLISGEQKNTIEFLEAQIRVLLLIHGEKRLFLTNSQRRLIAAKGKKIGRKAMMELTTICTPDTILRWHRQLIVKKWDYSDRPSKRSGRPRTAVEIVRLIVKFAKENPTWGYTRIQGALSNLGHTISDTTISNVLKAEGIEPAPERSMQWDTFLKAHWESICSIDFTTVEVWTKKGLATVYILLAMHLKTRRIEIAGVTPNPDGCWTKQMARNLSDSEDGFLKDADYLIVDRDTKFIPLRNYFEDFTGTKIVLLPPRSPNLNAHLERYMRSMKSECLDRMIFFGLAPLERALKDFADHYHQERNHQGLDNQLIEPLEEQECGLIKCRQRLGGLLRYYYRDAA